MLADLNLLLHEVANTLLRETRARTRSNAGRRTHRPVACVADVPGDAPRTVVVSGLPSPRKTALIVALQARLRGAGITVIASGTPLPEAGRFLHVHAAADVEALLESPVADVDGRRFGRADVIVPVDWEPLHRSLARVAEALIARGADAAELGS